MRTFLEKQLIESYNLKPFTFKFIKVVTEKRMFFTIYHYEVEVMDENMQMSFDEVFDKGFDKLSIEEINKFDSLSHVKNSEFDTLHECKTEVLKAMELILTY